MAPSTPMMTPHVTPIHSRLEDDDTCKWKAIATPPCPMPPHTGNSCLRHSGGSVARGMKRPSYVHHWVAAVGYILLGSLLSSSSAIKRGSAASSMCSLPFVVTAARDTKRPSYIYVHRCSRLDVLINIISVSRLH
eukprot:scaffold196546_cov29-Attheya_sp.AAC.2